MTYRFLYPVSFLHEVDGFIGVYDKLWSFSGREIIFGSSNLLECL